MNKGKYEKDKKCNPLTKETVLERPPFSQSSGSLSEAFLDHSISSSPYLSTIAHCFSKWSSFLHNMYHFPTYLNIFLFPVSQLE